MGPAPGQDPQNPHGRGAQKVERMREELNRINGFPVPDRDTGNNLAYLMQQIRRQLLPSESFAELGVEATQVMNDLWLSVKTSTTNTTLYLILTIAAIAAVILFFVISGIVRRRKKARRCRKWKQA